MTVAHREHLPLSGHWIVRPDVQSWPAAFAFINRLLREGGRVLVSGADPSSRLPAGTFIIPTHDVGLSPQPDEATLRRAADQAGVELARLDESASVIASLLRPVRVGLYGGGGAPFNHAAILATCGFPIRFLNEADVNAGELTTVDVFIMPGGGGRAMHGQLEPLGEDGCRAIAEWVRRGGMYIGCCAGSYDCIVNTAAFVESLPPQRCLQIINAAPWRADQAIEFLGVQSPGVGVIRVRAARHDHPVMWGMPDEFPIVHYNGPVLDILSERVVTGASRAIGLAEFAGWTERFTPAEAFAGQAPTEDTFISRAVAARRFAIAAGEFGLGRVVAFGSHPEFGFDLAMTEWGAPARMLANAVLWQATASPVRCPQPVMESDFPGHSIALPAGSALIRVPDQVRPLTKRAAELQARSLDPQPSWLAPAYALSVFGLSPVEIWHQALSEIQTLAERIAALALQLHSRLSTLSELSNDATRPTIQDTLLLADRLTLAERAPEWDQDGGFQGILALLRSATTMCETALNNWDIELGPPAGPYGYLAENPYHLVAGSYLAAVGLVAGAFHLLRVIEAETTLAEWRAGSQRPALVTA